MNIPKIIHQLWIGPKTPPTKFMDTWKNKHETDGFEYIRWTEEEMENRGFKSQLTNKLNEMEEINGQADIIRWELLYEYGGFFVDADAYCIESVKQLIDKYDAFVGFENEMIRGPGWNSDYTDVLSQTHPLIATGTMAFPPKHELPRLAIEWIKNNPISFKDTGTRAWRTVGPGLLTRLYHQQKWNEITVLPSYLFLPIHASGCTYIGHAKVYANQEWGSTKNSYDYMNTIELPDIMKTPSISVSILMPCYNITASFFKETLQSIIDQNAVVFINLVCINDGSNTLCSKILQKMLQEFEKNSRWIKVHYFENEKNIGIGPTLHKGVTLCPDEIIFRMDSDDIMLPNRIETQLQFMNETPECVLCGAQVSIFKDNKPDHSIYVSRHQTITLDDYKKRPHHWIINHPTFCFRKSKILAIGNYNPNLREMVEDFELELRILKEYKIIHNLPEVLLLYRQSPGQITKIQGGKPVSYWRNIRNKLFNDILGSKPVLLLS